MKSKTKLNKFTILIFAILLFTGCASGPHVQKINTKVVSLEKRIELAEKREEQESYALIMQKIRTIESRLERLEVEKQQIQSPIPQSPITQSNGPDLIITDINYKEPYIYVSYTNQGPGMIPGDFLISISHRKTDKRFPGNKLYRFKVPKPGEIQRTGGFTIGLIGLEKGMTAIIMAEIDWENRVTEAKEDNNIFYKQLTLD